MLDAPSNLGLRALDPNVEPGCFLLPETLRSEGLLERLNADDGGRVPAPSYPHADWKPGDGVRHAEAIASYSARLASRLEAILAKDEFPLVLGGDCSILLAPMLAMRRRGRFGLVALDGPDFRHPDNSDHVGAAAGESLAMVTGRGDRRLTNIDGLAPYVRDQDTVLIGMREDDEFRQEVEKTLTSVLATEVHQEGAGYAVRQALWNVAECEGFWVHVDADVLDPTVMPAVDTPEEGGIDFPQLQEILAGLLASPHCVGMDVTIYDPLQDGDGSAGRNLTNAIVAALHAAGRGVVY
ncbi:arginase family protein [Natronoglycomyces albus]|uniref:Arginase family protein n=1 Tax=Natronoglycomyces albus TaxID=2811108 RepID=A0A895XUM3_9ACTN|nr:arginase family protein [Natronoglycomyces albus]